MWICAASSPALAPPLLPPSVYLRNSAERVGLADPAPHPSRQGTAATVLRIRRYADVSVAGRGRRRRSHRRDVHTFLATTAARKARRGSRSTRGYIGRSASDSCPLLSPTRYTSEPLAPPGARRGVAGRGDGSYTVRTLPAGRPPPSRHTVTLTPRADAASGPASPVPRPARIRLAPAHPVNVSKTARRRRPGGSRQPDPRRGPHVPPQGSRPARWPPTEEVFGFTPLDPIDWLRPWPECIACVLP